MLLALAVVGTASPAGAQDAAAGTDKAAEATATPTPPAPKIVALAVDQIGVESEKAKRWVAEALEKLKAEKGIVALSEEIPKREEEVDGLTKMSAELRARDASLAEVDQVRQQWGALLEALDAIQVEFGKRSADITRMRERLSTDEEIWSATAAAADEAGEEESVVAQIDETLADLSRGIAEAKSRQGEIASLQSRVAGLSETALADLKKLAEIRATLVGRVFEHDRISMWEPEFYELLTAEQMKERLTEHGDREIATLLRFVDRYRERLVVHLGATLALCFITLTARRHIRRFQKEHADEDPALEHMEAVFDQPIAVALLLSLFVGLWGYLEIPPLAAPVVGATALLPAVLILRKLVPAPVRPVLYVLLALFFVDRLNAAVAPLPGLPRLVFIGEMLALLALVLWWRRPARLKDVSHTRREAAPFRWLALGLQIALVTTPVAILAEVAGYTALARLLGGTVLAAGYAGMMLYGSIVAVDGFVAFLLRVRPLRLSGMVERHRLLIAQKIQLVVRWIAILLFLWVLLNRLEIVDGVWDALVAFWSFEIPVIAVNVTFGSIIEFLIIVRLTLLVSRFIQFALDEEVYTRVRMPKGQPYAVSTLTHYTILFFGFLLAVFALGLDVNRFTVLAGAFGVGIGFGLQTMVNNFVSGIILLTEQPVQVGDTIELEGVWGEVQRIGMRSSTVRTWQGAEVIVPNAQLVSEQVTNWTLSDARRRLEIPVGVAYGTDPGLVISTIERVAQRHELVLSSPAPLVLFTNFGDSALEFELRCWTDIPDKYLSIKSSLLVGVEAALRDAGVTIPFPQRDLHLKSIEPDVADGLAGRGAADGTGDGD